jgi:hypothetical protein
MKKFIRPYTAYVLMYVSYRISLYLLNELFSMVDEIIDTDRNAQNNNNELIEGTNGIVTTHDYNTCKEVVNILNMRGGQNGILARGAGGVIQVSFQHLRKFGGKTVSIILKPIAKSVGFVLMKIPMLQAVYKTVKTGKVIIASSAALAAIRLIARFDYWALIFGDAIPLISVDQKAVLASIRRMRMGVMHMNVCTPQTNEIINLASDENVNLIKKETMLINLFSMYEFLPENHPFKNRYFACVIHVLLALFIVSKTGFNLALKLLLRLVKDGSITLQTYREIISQLIIGGVSPTEIDIV